MGALDQYGTERVGRLIFATIRKTVGLKGLINRHDPRDGEILLGIKMIKISEIHLLGTLGQIYGVNILTTLHATSKCRDYFL